MNGSLQDCTISSALARQILQYCTESLIFKFKFQIQIHWPLKHFTYLYVSLKDIFYFYLTVKYLVISDCELDCPKGYVIDDQNNILCECVQPQQCPVLKNCDKDCMYGYRINSKGCKRCRCNKCPPFVCKKKCRHGYKESHRGCQLCRCRGELDL